MWNWLKQHKGTITIVLVTIGTMLYIYGCEPKVVSLNSSRRLVTRQELQMELDTLMSMAQIRIADLDRQDRLRSLVLQNALVLVQGQPLNPVGLITGIAAIYGLTQGGQNITKVVKNVRDKRRDKNATS